MTFKEKLCHHGWRDCLKFSGGMLKKTHTTLMKQVVSGELCLIVDLERRVSSVKEGKGAIMERFTVALITNAAGGKEKAIVIGKSENPCCYKGIDKASLLVQYFSQRKAWMTGEILGEMFTAFNHHLLRANCSIILLIDNAGCHPHHLKEKFSNIKIVFLSEYVSGDDCLPVCLELDDDRWDEHFMANIAGAQECDNEDEEGRSDNGSDREDQAAIPQLKSLKKLLHHLNKYNTFWNATELVFRQMRCLVL